MKFYCKFCNAELLGFYCSWDSSKSRYDLEDLIDYDCLNENCSNNYVITYSKKNKTIISETFDIDFDGSGLTTIVNRLDTNKTTIFHHKELEIDASINFSSKTDLLDKIRTYILFL